MMNLPKNDGKDGKCKINETKKGGSPTSMQIRNGAVATEGFEPADGLTKY